MSTPVQDLDEKAKWRAFAALRGYHLAFLAGGGLSVLLLLVALALGLADLRQRRKDRARADA